MMNTTSSQVSLSAIRVTALTRDPSTEGAKFNDFISFLFYYLLYYLFYFLIIFILCFRKIFSHFNNVSHLAKVLIEIHKLTNKKAAASSSSLVCGAILSGTERETDLEMGQWFI